MPRISGRKVAAALLTLSAVALCALGGLIALDSLAGGMISDPRNLLWWIERSGEEAKLALLYVSPSDRVRLRLEIARERLSELYKNILDREAAEFLVREYEAELEAAVREAKASGSRELVEEVKKAVEEQRDELVMAAASVRAEYEGPIQRAMRATALAIEELNS